MGGQYRDAGKVTELTRQQTRFLSLMQGYGEAQEYAAIAADSAGMSAQKLAIYQESLEAKTQRAAAAFERLSTTLLDSGLVGAVMDIGAAIFNAVSAFDGLPAKIIAVVAAVGALVPLFRALASSSIGVSFGQTFAGIKNFIPSLISLGNATKLLSTAGANMAPLMTQLGASFTNMSNAQILTFASTQGLSLEYFKLAINASGLDEEQREAIISTYEMNIASKTTAAGMSGASAATGGFRAALTGLGATIKAHPILFLVSTLAALIPIIISIANKVSKASQEAIDKAKELSDAYAEVESTLSESVSTVESLADEFDRLSRGVDAYGNNISLDTSDYERYQSIVEQLVGMNPTLVKGYNSEETAIIDKNAAIKQTIEYLKEQQALELSRATTGEVNWDIAKGAREAYKQAAQAVSDGRAEIVSTFVTSFGSSLSDGELADGTISQDTLDSFNEFAEIFNRTGQNIGDWDQILVELRTNSDETYSIIRDNYGAIIDLLDHDSAIMLNNQLRAVSQFQSAADTATKGYQNQLRLIAQASVGYDELGDATRGFLDAWISSTDVSKSWTEDATANLTTTIQSLVYRLSVAGPDVKNAFAGLFALNFDDVSGEVYNANLQSAIAWLQVLADDIGLALSKEDLATIGARLGVELVLVDSGTGIEIGAVNERDGFIETVRAKLGPDFEGNLSDFTLGELKILAGLDLTGIENNDDVIQALDTHAQEAAESVETLAGRLAALPSDFDILSDAIDALESGSLDSFLGSDNIDSLLDKFPQLIDELQDYANGLLTAEELQTEFNKALQAARYDEISDALDDVVSSADDYGTSSYQVNEAMETLSGLLPGLRDALYNAETGTWNLSAGAYSTAAALLSAATESARLKVESDKLNLNNAIEQFKNGTRSAASYAATVLAAKAALSESQALFEDLSNIQISVNLSGGGGGGGGGSSDPWKERFEAEYNTQKHYLAMERITQQQYIDWLDGAYKNYFSNLEKYLDEYRQYEEEVFEGRKELTDAQLSDMEHQIMLWENQGNQTNKIIMQYRTMQDVVHQTAEALRDMLRAAGLSALEIEQNDTIQEYQKLWWDYENEIKDIEEDLAQTRIDNLNDIIELTEDMIKQESEDMIDAIESQIDAYKEIIELKKESLELAEREREYNDEVAEKTAEIAKLQKLADALALDDTRASAIERGSVLEQIAELQKELDATQREYSIENQEDALDRELDAFEAEKDDEIKAIKDFLADNEALNKAALARLDNLNQNLFNDLLRYALKYTDTTRQEFQTMWDEAINAANEYGDVLTALNTFEAGGGTLKSTLSAKVDEMRANSQKWSRKNTPEQNQLLEDRNAEIAKEISTLTGLKVERESATGIWYIYTANGKKQLYQEYHTGTPSVGGAPNPKQNELWALLEKKEMVLTEHHQDNLASLLSSVSPSNILSKVVSSLSSLVRGTPSTASVGSSPIYVDASIVVEGYADKQVMDVIERYPRRVAAAVADQFGV